MDPLSTLLDHVALAKCQRDMNSTGSKAQQSCHINKIRTSALCGEAIYKLLSQSYQGLVLLEFTVWQFKPFCSGPDAVTLYGLAGADTLVERAGKGTFKTRVRTSVANAHPRSYAPVFQPAHSFSFCRPTHPT